MAKYNAAKSTVLKQQIRNFVKTIKDLQSVQTDKLQSHPNLDTFGALQQLSQSMIENGTVPGQQNESSPDEADAGPATNSFPRSPPVSTSRHRSSRPMRTPPFETNPTRHNINVQTRSNRNQQYHIRARDVDGVIVIDAGSLAELEIHPASIKNSEGGTSPGYIRFSNDISINIISSTSVAGIGCPIRGFSRPDEAIMIQLGNDPAKPSIGTATLKYTPGNLSRFINARFHVCNFARPLIIIGKPTMEEAGHSTLSTR